MVKCALLAVSLCASLAFAGEGLVAARELPAGTKVTSADVSSAQVPDGLSAVVVSGQALSRVEGRVLRFPLRKGDLVLWSAFTSDLALVGRCAPAREEKR